MELELEGLDYDDWVTVSPPSTVGGWAQVCVSTGHA